MTERTDRIKEHLEWHGYTLMRWQMAWAFHKNHKTIESTIQWPNNDDVTIEELYEHLLGLALADKSLTGDMIADLATKLQAQIAFSRLQRGGWGVRQLDDENPMHHFADTIEGAVAAFWLKVFIDAEVE